MTGQIQPMSCWKVLNRDDKCHKAIQKNKYPAGKTDSLNIKYTHQLIMDNETDNNTKAEILFYDMIPSPKRYTARKTILLNNS